MNPLSSDCGCVGRGVCSSGAVAAALLGACPSMAPAAPSLPHLRHLLPALVFLLVEHACRSVRPLRLLPRIHFSKEEGG